MKKTLLVLLASLLLACTSKEASSSSVSSLPQFNPGKNAMLYLEMEKGGCTGVKLGSHTMLTAQHCFDLGGTLQSVNAKHCEGGIVYKDGNDHVIVRTVCRLPGVAAKVGKVPPVGTEVYLWGNPLGLTNMLRVGRLAGTIHDDGPCKPICDAWDINLWHGDSGGALFDATGKVVAIVYGYRGDQDRVWRLGLTLPILFTPEQLGDAM